MKYDVIVVGAGSSGGPLAARLSEDGQRSVLLLEAGPTFRSLREVPEEVRRERRWPPRLRVTPTTGPSSRNLTPNVEYSIARGRVMGGSSSINGALFTRGTREDFDTWEACGNGEWSWDKVLPYFRKLEDDRDFDNEYHGQGGPIPVVRQQQSKMSPISHAFVEACRDMGFPAEPDKNAPGPPGVGPLPVNVIDGVRFSTALAYLIPNLMRPNLTITGNAFVHRVLFDGTRAVGVDVEIDHEMLTIRGDEIVLCTGAIKSPHILLLSGVGPAPELQALGIPVVHDLAMVGKNLTDHVDIDITYQAIDDLPSDPDALMAQVALHYTAEGSDVIGGMEILPIVVSLGAQTHQRRLSFVANSQHEDSRGEVRIRSIDAHTAPDLHYNYMSEAGDRERARANVRLALELLESTPMRPFLVLRTSPDGIDVASDKDLDQWLMTNLGTAFHTSSTCKMGDASDETAVVDQRCRVHGLENIRVIDTSIMPEIVRRGPNATAIMIGERASEFF